MKVLVTGRGSSGSWAIRGEQIGAALGAVVKPKATLADMKAADVVLVIKRVPGEMLDDLRRSGRPWAYDIVDAYPQPECTTWSRRDAVGWVKRHVQRLQPNAVIWPTRQMHEDCGEGTVVYHHHRPGIELNPVRAKLETVGYEGSPGYLDGWQQAIETECRKRRIRFIVNPQRLADVDVVLAVRGPATSGYAQRNWKSNVKLANAHASGTPFIGARERGYIETTTNAEHWADTPEELGTALDWLESQAGRKAISERYLAAAFPVERAAEQVRAVLCGLRS